MRALDLESDSDDENDVSIYEALRIDPMVMVRRMLSIVFPFQNLAGGLLDSNGRPSHSQRLGAIATNQAPDFWGPLVCVVSHGSMLAMGGSGIQQASGLIAWCVLIWLLGSSVTYFATRALLQRKKGDDDRRGTSTRPTIINYSQVCMVQGYASVPLTLSTLLGVVLSVVGGDWISVLTRIFGCLWATSSTGLFLVQVPCFSKQIFSNTCAIRSECQFLFSGLPRILTYAHAQMHTRALSLSLSLSLSYSYFFMFSRKASITSLAGEKIAGSLSDSTAEHIYGELTEPDTVLKWPFPSRYIHQRVH